jgi:RNA polymerase sigma factor (TIGR02999 family)
MYAQAPDPVTVDDPAEILRIRSSLNSPKAVGRLRQVGGSFYMSESGRGVVTRVLQAVDAGDPAAAEKLLPIVYAELRRLGRSLMARIPPGNTLQPTALVHEAYLRLVGAKDPGWNSRGHFFAAAALAMRHILVDQARRKAQPKHGGDRKRLDADEIDIRVEPPSVDMLALDEALESLRRRDKRKCDVVMMRYFAGLTIEETARVLDVSEATVERDWRFARAVLLEQLSPRSNGKPDTRRS